MPCPTPAKQGYVEPGDAWAVLERQRRAGANVSHTYLCQCGMWHVSGIQTSSYTHQRKRNHRRKGGRTRRGRRGQKYRHRR